MRTVNVYLKITTTDSKTFKTMVKETGSSVCDCLDKAVAEWKNDKVEIEHWICC